MHSNKQSSREKLTPMELEIMQSLWSLGTASIREVQEALPKKRKVEYTTVQTIVYRLEKKDAVRRTKKIGNAHIFEPTITQKSAVGSLVDDFLKIFGGSPEPIMSHFVDSGKLTLEDLKVLEQAIKESETQEAEK